MTLLSSKYDLVRISNVMKQIQPESSSGGHEHTMEVGSADGVHGGEWSSETTPEYFLHISKHLSPSALTTKDCLNEKRDKDSREIQE